MTFEALPLDLGMSFPCLLSVLSSANDVSMRNFIMVRRRLTACAKFHVLIVSVVGAEIELDRGPISYARQR